MARFLDRLNTRWLRMSEKVASGALFHARLHKADRIFCGHTHAAMTRERDGLGYYNSGGWVDAHPTYITIDEGGVRIHEYQERPAIARPAKNQTKPVQQCMNSPTNRKC